MKIKRILFITNGTQVTASSRTRGYNYKPFLENKGFKITIIPYNSNIDSHSSIMSNEKSLAVKVFNKLDRLLKCVIYVLIGTFYDLVYIQRALLPVVVFRVIRSLDKKIIFDFDDAIYLTDEKYLTRFQNIIKLSDHIITSNHILKEIAEKWNNRVTVIPTCIDTGKIFPDKHTCNGKIVIGWMGSPPATKYIEILRDVFGELSKKYRDNIKLELVGSSRIKGIEMEVCFKKWDIEREKNDLNNFDIGIMPLDKDEWSTAKGGYKLIQYMSVGIPCVASPVGINKELVEDGVTGFLVETTRDWIDKLSILIENADLRSVMGNRGRQKVEKGYSYKVNIPKLIDIFES